MSRCRSDDKELGPLGQPDVLTPKMLDGFEWTGVNGPSCERFECRRTNKLSRRLGHDNGDLGTRLHQFAAQIRDLIGGDSACDAQQDFATIHDHKSSSDGPLEKCRSRFSSLRVM